MTLKQRLMNALEEALSEEKALLAVLRDKERDAVGTFEHWTAKDHVAHAAEWAHRYAVIEEARRRGEEPAKYGDEANPEIFEKHRTASCADVEKFAESAQRSLVDQLESLPDNELATPVPGDGGRERPRWRIYAGAGYIHVASHLGLAYLHLGDKAAATRIEERAAETLKPMDDSDNWNGTIHYNLACHYALVGKLDKALEELRHGLRLAPDITEWSKEDPDLEALRGLDEYKKLYD